jgi:predicted RNase H-like HicB family nuclease
MNYIGLIHKDRGSDYGVSFPDFPGVVTAGKDLDDARRMAEEALALHIDGMLEDGDAIPKPSSLEDGAANRDRRFPTTMLIVTSFLFGLLPSISLDATMSRPGGDTSGNLTIPLACVSISPPCAIESKMSLPICRSVGRGTINCECNVTSVALNAERPRYMDRDV